MSIQLKRKLGSGTGAKRGQASSHIHYKNVHPSVEPSLYYGFTPLPSPLVISREDRERVRGLGHEHKAEPASLAPTLEERVAVFRHYTERNLFEHAQPILLCGEFSTGATGKKKPCDRRLLFEIVGSHKSIAEALLIQTAIATLREEGHTDLVLAINSVGDKDSMNRFIRELGNYYRKHIAFIPQSCKALMRRNLLELLHCDHEKCRALAAEAPKSLGFLGEDSRRHFKEVLEFLEELEIPYRLDPTLIGSSIFASETIFEIIEESTGKESRCLCSGARYNTLGKRLGLKRDAPAVGMNLLLVNERAGAGAKRQVKIRKPSVYFLQLGFRAKLKSLQVIEMLRKMHIPLHHALSRDKLLSQISSAENLRIPYSLILGEREALENSVIIRNTTTRAQETVKIKDLPSYFKKLRLV